MQIKEIELLIENQSLNQMNGNGIDGFPGKFILLDSEEIECKDETITIKLYAWVDKKCKHPMFVVRNKWTYTITDHLFEAYNVFKYYTDEV